MDAFCKLVAILAGNPGWKRATDSRAILVLTEIDRSKVGEYTGMRAVLDKTFKGYSLVLEAGGVFEKPRTYPPRPTPEYHDLWWIMHPPTDTGEKIRMEWTSDALGADQETELRRLWRLACTNKANEDASIALFLIR